MPQQIVRLNKFYPGLSQSKFSGVAGAFAKAVGVDIHSEPGVLKAQQVLAKDSGATVVDLILASVHTSGGHSYHFGDTGKIYKRTSGGSWSVLQTVTGNPAILGAAEHSDGKVYFTYANKVGTLLVSDDTYVEADQTLTNTNTTYGKVLYHEKKDAIFIANQELVAEVSSSGVFTANKLDLKAKYVIRDLAPLDIDLIVAATNKGNTKQSAFFQWDMVSVSWDFSWFIGDSINWIVNKQETIIASVGADGQLYQLPDLVNPIGQIPGAYSSTAQLASHVNSKVIFKGFLHFGMYDGSSANPFPNGVFTFGSSNANVFPNALNLDYPISTGETVGIELGAVSTDGSNLFVAWKNTAGDTYGVDKINFTAKYGTPYIEFLVLTLQGELEKKFERFPLLMKPLPASCTIELKEDVDLSGSFTSVATVSTDNAIDDELAFVGEGVSDGKIIQVRLDLVASANTSPEIIELGVLFDSFPFE